MTLMATLLATLMGSGLRFYDSDLLSQNLFDLIAAYGAGRDLQEELDDLIIRHY